MLRGGLYGTDLMIVLIIAGLLVLLLLTALVVWCKYSDDNRRGNLSFWKDLFDVSST